jgi:hypothetical protein
MIDFRGIHPRSILKVATRTEKYDLNEQWMICSKVMLFQIKPKLKERVCGGMLTQLSDLDVPFAFALKNSEMN